MVGKGAPVRNDYAKKERAGWTISLYLRSEDIEILREFWKVTHQGNENEPGKEPGKADLTKLAKEAAKRGIHSLPLDLREDSMKSWNEAEAEAEAERAVRAAKEQDDDTAVYSSPSGEHDPL